MRSGPLWVRILSTYEFFSGGALRRRYTSWDIEMMYEFSKSHFLTFFDVDACFKVCALPIEYFGEQYVYSYIMGHIDDI